MNRYKGNQKNKNIMLSYNQKNNIAVCVLCKVPNEEWLRFLNNFNKYDVFIIIDDNSATYTEYSEKYKNINIIQIVVIIFRKLF